MEGLFLLGGLLWLASPPAAYVDAREHSRQAAWTWALFAAAVPVVGLPCYWAIGRNDVERDGVRGSRRPGARSRDGADALPEQFRHGSDPESSVSPESAEANRTDQGGAVGGGS